jgi:hypothetical protein
MLNWVVKGGITHVHGGQICLLKSCDIHIRVCTVYIIGYCDPTFRLRSVPPLLVFISHQPWWWQQTVSETLHYNVILAKQIAGKDYWTLIVLCVIWYEVPHYVIFSVLLDCRLIYNDAKTHEVLFDVKWLDLNRRGVGGGGGGWSFVACVLGL